MKASSQPPQLRTNAGSQLSAGRRWGILLCLILVACVAAAQAVHFHAHEFSNHENCVVCQLAHAPKLANAAIVVVVTFAPAAFLTVVSTSAPQLAIHEFSLLCRPPPSSSI